MPKYTQAIIDAVYSRGCAKREVIVDVVSERLGVPKERSRLAVATALRRLLRAGLLERRGRGYYCKPSADTYRA